MSDQIDQMDLLSQITKDDELDLLPTDTQASRLADLAVEYRRLEAEIESTEAKLEDLGKKFKLLRTVTIPDLMTQLRLSSIKTDEQTSVEVGKKYYAYISAKNKDAAFAWLRDNGSGDIIKNQFSVVYGKGDDEKANALREVLVEKKVEFEQQETVHSGTLNAFFREQTEAGIELPAECFSTMIENVAVVTIPKSKKPRKTK